jgi:shikimate kinase
MKVILIGLRGTGKTVCGQLLAQRLGWAFFDTDEAIQERAGRSIRDIFAQDGEPGFRRLEAEVVRHAAKLDKAVVATGGGAVLDPANVAALREGSFVVHLSAGPEELARRILADPASAAQRPPLVKGAGEPVDEMRRLLLSRAAAYRAARDAEVVVEGRTPEQVAGAILVLMRARSLPLS